MTNQPRNLTTATTGSLADDPSVVFGKDGTSFIADVNGEPVRVLIPTAQLENFVTRLAKGAAIMEDMRRKVEAREVAYTAHDAIEADMSLAPPPSKSALSPLSLSLMDSSQLPTCGEECGCSQD